MKLIKQIVFLSLFLSLPGWAWAQMDRGYTVGTTFATAISNKFTASPEIGLDLGYYSTVVLSNRVEIFYGLDLYTGSFIINYKSGDTLSINPNKSASAVMSNTGVKLGLGVNYYIVPNRFCVSAGVFGEYNSFNFEGDGTYVIGYDALGYQSPVSISNVTDAMTGINYGATIGVEYRFGKHALSLKYDLGLNNFNSGQYDLDYKTGNTVQYSTTFSTLLFSYHYFLYEFSLAKPYQNKMLK